MGLGWNRALLQVNMKPKLPTSSKQRLVRSDPGDHTQASHRPLASHLYMSLHSVSFLRFKVYKVLQIDDTILSPQKRHNTHASWEGREKSAVLFLALSTLKF